MQRWTNTWIGQANNEVNRKTNSRADRPVSHAVCSRVQPEGLPCIASGEYCMHSNSNTPTTCRSVSSSAARATPQLNMSYRSPISETFANAYWHTQSW